MVVTRSSRKKAAEPADSPSVSSPASSAASTADVSVASSATQVATRASTRSVSKGAAPTKAVAADRPARGRPAGRGRRKTMEVTVEIEPRTVPKAVKAAAKPKSVKASTRSKTTKAAAKPKTVKAAAKPKVTKPEAKPKTLNAEDTMEETNDAQSATDDDSLGSKAEPEAERGHGDGDGMSVDPSSESEQDNGGDETTDDEDDLYAMDDDEISDYEAPRARATRRKRRRAGGVDEPERGIMSRFEESEADEAEGSAADQAEGSASDQAKAKCVKRARVLAAAEMMPLAGDMRLVLSPDAYRAIVPETAAKSSEDRLRERKRVKMPKRKNGVKSRREALEGDLTDDEGGDVDPRDLPTSDIDYSRFARLFSNHPHLRHAWSGLAEPRAAAKIAQPAALKIRLLPFQQEGVQWMCDQERTEFRGGILADEMGMGKTLQTIGLLLANGGAPTLVVCPTVALLQWKAEIAAATDALSVFVFYGNDRKKLADDAGTVNADELSRHDVVLTTYGVLESAQRREKTGFRRLGALHFEKSVLHAIAWHRVVLDEAHHLKDRGSNTSRAAFALSSQHTWSLTGTPLHNRVGELYALIRLTKTDPFCMYFCHSCGCKSLQWQFRQSKHCSGCGCRHTVHFSYWNMHVMKPIQDHAIRSAESEMGFRKLARLLDNVMLRRTKVERADDMGLPPRVVVTRRDRFSAEEEDLYMSLFSDYRREFDTYTMHGTVLNNYANIFELITRMRLAANHPDLLRLKLGAQGPAARDTLVCAICNEEAEEPIVARCRHVFCRMDATVFVNGAASGAALRCPTCFAQFDIDLAQPEMRRAQRPAAEATLMESMVTTPGTTEYRRSIVNRIDMRTWRSSTKIEALVEELSRLRQGAATVKSIVFSQFVSFLDLIQWRLNRAGFSVCRLDGRMTPTQRDAVIRTFMTRPEYTVFLVSLKAGGVALNLTEASHVFLADCWWNPSVEVQAMDRIHRMGQHRPIKVTRIIIDNSIESRIIALQVKKQLLVSSTIGRDKKSLDRLSEQDMEFLFSS